MNIDQNEPMIEQWRPKSMKNHQNITNNQTKKAQISNDRTKESLKSNREARE